MAKKKKGYSFWAAVATAALVAFILEVFVFQFRYFQPMNDEISVFSVEPGVGTVKTASGFVFINKEDGTEYSTHEIHIIDINEKVDNLYINLNTEDETNEITVLATDEANSLEYELGTRTFVNKVESSHYMQLNMSGDTSNITLKITGTAGTSIKTGDIGLNVREPFQWSSLRFFLVFLLALSVVCIYMEIDIHYCSDKWYRYVIIAGAICLQIAFFGKVVKMNPDFTEPSWSWHKQYQELAKNLPHGRLSVYDDAPQALIDMENPYDTELRNQVLAENKVSSRWDTAFYKGKYYVYFGVVPVILFYIPYQMIKHADLPNYMAVFYASIIMIIGAYGLVGSIIRKYFKKTSLLTYLLITTCVINGSGILYLVKRPDLYSVPIMSGIAFTMLGLFLWIEASMCHKKVRGKVLIALGSLSMALVAGCRPQLLLGSFVAIPLFGKYFVDGIRKKDKDAITNLVTFMIPYIVIAAFIMWYNYARFGSVFDFGANYNLTTNDMTKRGFDAGRNGIAIFSYLFQTPHISATFPFVYSGRYYTSYLGNDIWETLFGGLISCNMFMWIVFTTRSAWKSSAGAVRQLTAIGVWFVASALIVAFADAQMGGVLQRYMSDIGVFMVLGSAVLWLVHLNKENANTKLFRRLLLYASILTMSYNVCLIFVLGSRSLQDSNPELFYEFYHLVQFWL